MSILSKAKTFAKFTNPYIAAADFVKDVVDPRTDVVSGVSSPVHFSGPQSGSFYDENVPSSLIEDTQPMGGGGNTSTSTLPNTGTYRRTNSTTAGGSGSGVDSTADDLSYLADQEARLRVQHGSADNTLANGLKQLLDSFNQETGKANVAQSRFLSDVGTKRQDDQRAKETAVGKVNTNARTLADSLRRRIGMASGSGSSAYQFAAPRAVSRVASQDRGEVMEDYGMNFRNLDTREKRGVEDFETLLAELAAQRQSREGDFRAGILDNKNQIDASLAEIARQRALLQGGGYTQARTASAPIVAAIDSRQREIDSLFDRFRTPYSVKPVDVSMPNLRDYTVDRAAISANQTQGPDDYSPYRRPFGEDEEEKLV